MDLTKVTSVAPDGTVLATSPESAAATPADAMALFMSMPWTVAPNGANTYATDALGAGMVPTAEEMAAWDEGWNGGVKTFYSPLPGVLVCKTVDPRNGYTAYSFGTEYTKWWDINSVNGPAGSTPVQLRRETDSRSPKGYSFQYFKAGVWNDMNTSYTKAGPAQVQ
jgi:hypothetical protein